MQGYDHVDVLELSKRGIVLGNTPGVLTETTADTAFALLMATARRVPEAVEAVKSGEWRDWRPEWMCGKDVWGSTVGIIGLGRIGLAFGRRASGFGCSILYSGRSRKPEAEEELLRRGCASVSYVSQEDVLTGSDFVVRGAFFLTLLSQSSVPPPPASRSSLLSHPFPLGPRLLQLPCPWPCGSTSPLLSSTSG